METLTSIMSVDLDSVPVITRDRFIPRKDQAKLTRILLKRLGIKGVSVTAPNYSMAQSVDVKVPRLPATEADFLLVCPTCHDPVGVGSCPTCHGNGRNYSNDVFSDMPDAVPAKIKHLTHWNALQKLEAILLRAFPNHDDRSDLQTDYFNYKWSVS